MNEKAFEILREMFGNEYSDEQLREIIQNYERLKKVTIKIILKGAKKVKTTFKAAKEGIKGFTDAIIARRERKEKGFTEEIAIIGEQRKIIKDRLKEAEENHSLGKISDRAYEDIKSGLNKQLSILEREEAKFQAKKDNKWALGNVLREQKAKHEDREFAKTVVGMVREEANALDNKSRVIVQPSPSLVNQPNVVSVDDSTKEREDERVIVQKPFVSPLPLAGSKVKSDNQKATIEPLPNRSLDSKLKIKDYFTSLETKLGEKLTKQLEGFKQGFISDVKDELQNILEERDRKHAEEITVTKENSEKEIAVIKEDNKKRIDELLEEVAGLKQQNNEIKDNYKKAKESAENLNNELDQIKKEMNNIRENVRLTPEVMGALGTLVDWTSGLSKVSKEGSLGINKPPTERELELETNEIMEKHQQELAAKEKNLDEGLAVHQKILSS